MSHILNAALWMIGAIASFSLMALAGRLLSHQLDTFEIMLYRSLIGFVLVCVLSFAFGTWREISRHQIGLHLLRNMAHFTGQNLWFFALPLIPLAQVFALEFTSPIWVILLGPLLLREPITPMRSLCAIIGFLGTLIVTRPSIETLNTGVVCAAIAAVFFALTNIFTKKLTQKHSITTILFFLTFMQLGFGLICAGYDGDIARPTLPNLPYVILIGLAGLVAHFCLTKALSLAPATVVIPMDFIRLPVIALIGMLLFNEAFDYWVIIGALVIFSGTYLNILNEHKSQRAPDV